MAIRYVKIQTYVYVKGPELVQVEQDGNVSFRTLNGEEYDINENEIMKTESLGVLKGDALPEWAQV